MTMKESNTIKNLLEIEPAIFHDLRGESFLTFSTDAYNLPDENNNTINFKEDNISLSRYNVLRGLHGDKKTWKLVQCLYGEVYFVVVDMRPGSPSYMKWESFTLNNKNRKQVLIPAGCVNGHYCLSAECLFSYKQSEIYKGSQEQISVKWDDPKLDINWPASEPVLSQRDAEALYL